MNPRECEWKNFYRIIMKTTLQEKRGNSLKYYNFGIYSYTSSNEDTRSKSSSGQGMGKLETISAWNMKVKSKKEVIDEARTSGATVHFASLMDICHLKMLNWRESTKNTKVELYSSVIL